MLKEILSLFMDELNKREKNDSRNDSRISQIIEEIHDLEIKLAGKLADAERWGDLTDNSNWRTAEVNKIKRIIEAKKQMIQTLKQNR